MSRTATMQAMLTSHHAPLQHYTGNGASGGTTTTTTTTTTTNYHSQPNALVPSPYAALLDNPPPYFLSALGFPMYRFQDPSMAANTESLRVSEQDEVMGETGGYDTVVQSKEMEGLVDTQTETESVKGEQKGEKERERARENKISANSVLADIAVAEQSQRFSPEKEEQLLSAAAIQKKSGNTLFTTHHPLAAIDAYTLALNSTPVYLSQHVAILHSNLAACYLSLSPPNGPTALLHSNEAVFRRPGWTKALLRRCRAREIVGTWEELEKAEAEYVGMLDGRGEGNVALEQSLGQAEREVVEKARARVRARIEVVRGKELGDVCKGLRQLGDGLLRPFGISTSDFGMKPDGKGGYSLSFQKGGGS